jgi:hypothetical protein
VKRAISFIKKKRKNYLRWGDRALRGKLAVGDALVDARRFVPTDAWEAFLRDCEFEASSSKSAMRFADKVARRQRKPTRTSHRRAWMAPGEGKARA